MSIKGYAGCILKSGVDQDCSLSSSSFQVSRLRLPVSDVRIEELRELKPEH